MFAEKIRTQSYCKVKQNPILQHCCPVIRELCSNAMNQAATSYHNESCWKFSYTDFI